MVAARSTATRYSKVTKGLITVHAFTLSRRRVVRHGRIVLTCSVCGRTDTEHEQWAKGSTL